MRSLSIRFLSVLSLSFIAFGTLASQPAEAQQAGLGTTVEPMKTRVLQSKPPFRPSPRPLDLGEVIGEKPVVFVHWLPGYPGSVAEVKALQKFAKSLKGDKLAVYAVTRARDEKEIEAVKDAIANAGITLPIILDDLSLSMKTGVREVPGYVVLDKSGKIVVDEVTGLNQKLQDGTRFTSILEQAASTGNPPGGKGPGRNAVYQLVGEKAPDFSLKTMEGKTKSSADLIGKKPLVLIFWSALCPHCQREMPKLQAYLEKNKGKVNMASITQYRNDYHKKATVDYVDKHDITFPVLIDDAGVNNRYSIGGIPTWMLIDTKGVIRHIAIGEKPGLDDLLDKEIAKATKG